MTMNDEVMSLEFSRLRIPRLIPPELIEAVKFKMFDAPTFYDYQEANLNDYDNILIALYDRDKKIKGYLWAVIDNGDRALFINTFSVAKEYWCKGKAMDKAIEIIKTLVTEFKPPSVRWITTNDKFFVKHGFKRSKDVIMEYVCVPSNEKSQPQQL